jgi:hypothetical protein
MMLLLSVAARTGAGDVAARIEEQFGNRLRDAESTVDRQDDRTVAQEMYAAAQQSPDPIFAGAVAEQVYALTSEDPRGSQIAADAMALLARIDPSRRLDAVTREAAMLQRLATVHTGDALVQTQERLIASLLSAADLSAAANQWDAAHAYAAEAASLASKVGSSRQAQVDTALDRLKVRRRIADLQARRKADPTDVAAADELLRLYLLDLDDPVSAAQFQFTASDPLLKENLGLASRDIASLNAGQCLTMGEWYRKLLKPASPAARPALAERSAAYYQQYLKLHSVEDAPRQGAVAALGTLEEIVRRLNAAEPAGGSAAAPPPLPGVRTPRTPSIPAPVAPVAPSPPPSPAATVKTPPAPGAPGVPGAPASPALADGAVDLMGNIITMSDAGRGLWDYAAGQLKGQPPTPAQFTLPTAPDGSYELSVAFKRTSSIGSVALHLPINDDHRVLLVIGERRRKQKDFVAGLSTISGKPAEDNATTAPFEITSDQVYDVKVKVEPDGGQVTITASIDGKQVVKWTGSSSDLDVSKAWARFDPKGFGLGIDGAGEVTFLHAHLKSTSGKPPKPLR